MIHNIFYYTEPRGLEISHIPKVKRPKRVLQKKEQIKVPRGICLANEAKNYTVKRHLYWKIIQTLHYREAFILQTNPNIIMPIDIYFNKQKSNNATSKEFCFPSTDQNKTSRKTMAFIKQKDIHHGWIQFTHDIKP